MQYSLEKGLQNIRNLHFQHFTNEIFCLFLPLDIDMQALAEILNDGKLENSKKEKKIIDYLTTEEEPKGMFKDNLENNVDYKKKLNVAQKKAKETEKVKNNDIIRRLLGLENKEDSRILKFMELLNSKKDEVKKNGKIPIENAKDIINYFSQNGGWKVKGANPEVIKSFHDWYRVLDSCLRAVDVEK
ncbi:MAG: hypothetical protein ACE5EA_05380 [Nitrospirota bacterium]